MPVINCYWIIDLNIVAANDAIDVIGSSIVDAIAMTFVTCASIISVIVALTSVITN